MSRLLRAVLVALFAAVVAAPVIAAAPAPQAPEISPAVAPQATAGEPTRTELGALAVVASVAQREGVAAGAPFEVGTPITLELRFEGDARTSAAIEATRTLGDFDVLSIVQPAEQKDGVVRGAVTLMAFESGTQTPPALRIRWSRGGVVTTSEVALPAVELRSVLGADIDPAKFRDIQGEIAIAADSRKTTTVIATIVAILAALLVAAFFIWRSLRANPPEQRADTWALDALRDLERDALPARGDFARFYDRLTGIVRGYTVRRFEIRADRQTSREFLEAATSHPSFPDAERDRLRGLLRLADLVRFAAATPESSECDEHLADARRFVEATRPRDDEPDTATRATATEAAR